MKRGVIALAITATVALLAPGIGSATPAGVQCGGTVADGATASCTYRFELDSSRFVSLLGTHANFDNLGGTGSLSVAWIDAEGNTVVEYACTGLGLPSKLHEHRLLCSESTPAADTYVAGVQTMVVEVLEASCPEGTCEYSGALVFSEEGDLA